MTWYIENPIRARQERETLDALASSVVWLAPGEWRIDASLRLIWDADILVGEKRFPVSLRYPNHFPHSPPLVLPRDVSERWSSHQYGAGGELCLEFGPDNWHPDIAGSDMIQSAYRLLQGENPAPDQRGRVASRHATTVGQDLRGDRRRLLVTHGLAQQVDAIEEGEILTGNVLCTFHDETSIYAVESISSQNGEKWTDEAIPRTIVRESLERQIALLRWPANADLPSCESRTAFCDTLSARGMELSDVNYVLLVQGEKLHGYFLWSDGDVASTISIVPPEPVAIRLDDEHAVLGSLKVAIVGCGSLGSKLAVMLARSGVSRFLLVDDDVMFPSNLVRHELDWREMGTHKVDSVARRIGLVHPSAQCAIRRQRLGGQEASGSIESLLGSLAECDLIVDASADPRVFNYLCAAVASGQKPFVWAQVFGGGFGGLIARHRLGIEPDPASMRAIIEQWCRDQGKPLERATADYETGSSSSPMIADDADVSVIAAHAARLSIDTLIARAPSLFPNSVYMIGLAERWIFEQPFDTRPIDVGVPQPGTSIVLDQQVVDEERARVMQMFQKFSDADRTDDTNNPTPPA